MFVATFVSNCPGKWAQLLRYCPSTRGQSLTHPAIFGFFMPSSQHIRKNKGSLKTSTKKQDLWS